MDILLHQHHTASHPISPETGKTLHEKIIINKNKKIKNGEPRIKSVRDTVKWVHMQLIIINPSRFFPKNTPAILLPKPPPVNRDHSSRSWSRGSRGPPWDPTARQARPLPPSTAWICGTCPGRGGASSAVISRDRRPLPSDHVAGPRGRRGRAEPVVGAGPRGV